MNEQDSSIKQKRAEPYVPFFFKNLTYAPKCLFRSIAVSIVFFSSSFAGYAQDENTPAATEEEPTTQHRMKLFTGASQIFKSQVDPIVGFELHPGWHWHGVGLWASLCGGRRTGSYASLGIDYAFSLSEKWRLTPSFGVGYFKEGKFVLGNELEFRSGIELSREFQRGYRIGVSLSHISNASIGDVNPGTEAVCVSVSLPFF